MSELKSLTVLEPVNNFFVCFKTVWLFSTLWYENLVNYHSRRAFCRPLPNKARPSAVAEEPSCTIRIAIEVNTVFKCELQYFPYALVGRKSVFKEKTSKNRYRINPLKFAKVFI